MEKYQIWPAMCCCIQKYVNQDTYGYKCWFAPAFPMPSASYLMNFDSSIMEHKIWVKKIDNIWPDDTTMEMVGDDPKISGTGEERGIFADLLTSFADFVPKLGKQALVFADAPIDPEGKRSFYLTDNNGEKKTFKKGRLAGNLVKTKTIRICFMVVYRPVDGVPQWCPTSNDIETTIRNEVDRQIMSQRIVPIEDEEVDMVDLFARMKRAAEATEAEGGEAGADGANEADGKPGEGESEALYSESSRARAFARVPRSFVSYALSTTISYITVDISLINQYIIHMKTNVKWCSGSYQSGVTVELTNVDGYVLLDLKENVQKTVEANKKVVEYNKLSFDKRPKEKPELKPLQDEDVEKILNFLKRLTQDFNFESSNVFADPLFDAPTANEVLL